jgi:hypothetical protein
MKRFVSGAILVALLAFLMPGVVPSASAASARHSAQATYSVAACTANPSLPGCAAVLQKAAGQAFAAAAAKASALAKQLRACLAAGKNCSALAAAFQAAVAQAKALAAKAGVPYVAPSTGGGGTYLASQPVTSLSSGYNMKQQVASGLHAVRALPTTGGGGSPSSPVTPWAGFLALLLALTGLGLRKVAAN